MKRHKHGATPTGGKEEATFLDDARETALDALADALADIHKVKNRGDDECERRSRRECDDDDDDLPRVAVETGGTMGDVLFDLARLQLDVVERVLRFQRKHRDLLFYRLPRARRMSCDGERSPTVVVLEGTPGATVTGTFVVENRGPAPAHVSAALSQLRTRTEDSLLLADAVFTPASPFRLQSDEERIVQIEVTLDPSFKAGCRYRGDITIATAGRTRQRIPVRVDVAHAPGHVKL